MTGNREIPDEVIDFVLQWRADGKMLKDAPAAVLERFGFTWQSESLRAAAVRSGRAGRYCPAERKFRPEVITFMRPIYSDGTMSWKTLAAALSAKFGGVYTVRQVKDAVSQHGLIRSEETAKRLGGRAMRPAISVEDVVLRRLNRPPCQEDHVRRVAPGAHPAPARGFSMLGGRAA